MLGKLIKYEFRNTAKVMLILYLFTAAVTAFGSVVLSMDVIQHGTSSITDVLTITTMLVYMLTIFALFVVTYIYMCIHFYKTMYSDQGYLTHTLPVKTLTTFHVKLFVSMIWTVLSCMVLIASVLALVTGVSRGEIWAEINPTLFEQFRTFFGLSFGQFLAYGGVSIVLSCLNYLLWIYASMSIGQLFGQHKIGASIAAGALLSVINQIASTIIMVITGYSTFLLFDEAAASSAQAARSIFGSFMNSAMIYNLLYIAALYMVCNVIVRKHINLD